MEHTAHEPAATLPVLTDENLETLIDALRRDPEALAHVVSRAGPDDGRSDGWTPFKRTFAEAQRWWESVLMNADVRQLGPAF